MQQQNNNNNKSILKVSSVNFSPVYISIYKQVLLFFLYIKTSQLPFHEMSL